MFTVMPRGRKHVDDLSVDLSWAGPGGPFEERTRNPAPRRPEPAVPAPAPAGGIRPSRATPPGAVRPADEAAPEAPSRLSRATETARPPTETLVNILEHLSTLSRLVTGTSKASTAELKALGSRVDKAVGELEALQQRVLRSLAGFDALRLRVQKEMADRPPLTDDDVDRIADAVTERLLMHVRVETEGDRQ